MQPSYTQFAPRLRRVEGPILVEARPMHNSCDVRMLWFVRFNAPPVFVSLNALEGWEGSAFTFSNDITEIWSIEKVNARLSG